MELTKKLTFSTLMMSLVVAPCVFSQEKTESSFYFGIGGGYHSSQMKVTELDKSIFPENSNLGSGLFDIFLQYEFGNKKQFGIRLEADFLRRGGILDNIGNTSRFPDLYAEEGVRNASYTFNSKYIDLRLPLIYQFCNSRSVIRPYVYVAPFVAFSTGGSIKAQTDYVDNSYEGSVLDITKGNIRSSYFGGAVGLGLKYDMNLHGHPFYISIEANYQMGFTDTYSKKEKEGMAVVKDDYFFHVYDITGKRRFNGFEVKGSLSIPFSVFSKKKKVLEEKLPEIPIVEVYREEDIEEAPVVNVEPVKEEEKVSNEVEEIPCRSIEEIYAMIERGENIHGVTFCAIDDIRFAIDKSEIDPYSYKYLDEVASILKRTNASIEVKGHTDNTGTEGHNEQLSRQRAMSVVRYLESKGVDKGQLSYSYYGSSNPIASNDTERGRSLNRRVEFEIK